MFGMPWLSVSSISTAKGVGDQYIKYNTVPNQLVSHPKPLRDSPGPRQKRVIYAYCTRVNLSVARVGNSILLHASGPQSLVRHQYWYHML